MPEPPAHWEAPWLWPGNPPESLALLRNISKSKSFQPEGFTALLQMVFLPSRPCSPPPPSLGHPWSGVCSGNTNPGERKHSHRAFPAHSPTAAPPRAVPEPVHRSRAQHLAGSCGSLPGTYPAAAALARACREQRGQGRHSCGQSWAQTQGRGSAPTSSERRGRKLFLGKSYFGAAASC